MTTDYINAIDEMFGLFNSNWVNFSPDVVGYLPYSCWQGKEEDMPPANQFWLRVSQQTVSEEQTALQGSEQKRYTCDGFLYVQIFCPKNESSTFDKGRVIADYVKKIFRGKKTDGGIVFSNVFIKELPDEDLYKRLNVVAQYEYDEVG